MRGIPPPGGAGKYPLQGTGDGSERIRKGFESAPGSSQERRGCADVEPLEATPILVGTGPRVRIVSIETCTNISRDTLEPAKASTRHERTVRFCRSKQGNPCVSESFDFEDRAGRGRTKPPFESTVTIRSVSADRRSRCVSHAHPDPVPVQEPFGTVVRTTGSPGSIGRNPKKRSFIWRNEVWGGDGMERTPHWRIQW